MRLSCTVFDIQPAICQKSPILAYSTCIWRPRWGDAGGISQRSLAAENYSSWAIVWFYLCDPVFSRFIRTPTCDRHRHRQTQGHSIYRASITLRGKNEKKIIVGLMIIIIVITTTSLSVIFQSAIFQARNSATALSVIFQSVKFQSFRFPRTSFSGREFSALVLVASLPVCCATTLASRYRFLNH